MSDKSAFITRGIAAYAHLLVKYPGKVLLTLLVLGLAGGWLTLRLTIEPDQLALISQDLPEVKEVKRVIDMVGGAGYLQLALRADDEAALKKLADAVHETLLAAKLPDGSPSVRFITYKVPVEFVRENMVLFIRNEDLVEAKRRIDPYVKDQLRRNNPFFIELQENAKFFKRVLEKKPFDVTGVPETYARLFRHLPTTRPENHGYLTFLYPKVDLWDGKNLMAFADQTNLIEGKSGKKYQSAGLAILYAKLARIVLFDAKLTVLLAALWILVMHYLDFRSVKLALASVLPLGVGLWMMLGLLSVTNHRLNFMNLVILPILLGFGVSHGLYLLHRFLEGTSPPRLRSGRAGVRHDGGRLA